MPTAFVRVTIGMIALLLAFAQAAYCADVWPTPEMPAPAYPAAAVAPPADNFQMWSSSIYDPSRWEVRGGLFASIHGPELGSFNINGELIAPKFYTVPGIWDIFIPRLHIGGMGNLDGKTSYAYTGLLWTLNYTQNIFGEIFAGAGIHDGQINGPSPQFASLGCRELIHAGMSLGYRFDPSWSTMLTFDHMSNGKGTLSTCVTNQSINVLGLRFGYSFK